MKAEDLAVYGTLLDVQQSDSSDSKYEIRWNKQTGYHCDCQGFIASRKTPKQCKHVKRFEFKSRLEQKLMELSNRGFITFPSVGAMESVCRQSLEIAKKTWEGVV